MLQGGKLLQGVPLAPCGGKRVCEHIHCLCDTPLNTYRTAASPTLDLLCKEDFKVGRSKAESNNEMFLA